MISKIKVIHKCNSCAQEEEFIMGHTWDEFGIWNDIEGIVNEIKLGLIPGWVRDGNLMSWCANCHMKKQIRKK